MNIAELKAAFGAYYRQEGQGVKDLDTAIVQPLVTEQFFNSRPTLNTQERRMKAMIGKVLRQRQTALTAESSLEIKPRVIDLQPLSYEVRETPMEIEDSYAGFLANPDNNMYKDWTIVQYIVNELMLKKGRQEYELDEVYYGVAGAITPGVANPAGENFNGLKHLINEFITEGSIIPVSAPTTWDTNPANVIDELEAWINDVKATSNEARLLVNAGMEIGLSPELFELAMRGIHKNYNVNYNATGDNITDRPQSVKLPFGKTRLFELPSMSGAQELIMTPSWNRAAFIKRPISESGPNVQEVGREVVIFSDFWKGIGFWHPEYVYVTPHIVTEEEI